MRWGWIECTQTLKSIGETLWEDTMFASEFFFGGVEYVYVATAFIDGHKGVEL